MKKIALIAALFVSFSASAQFQSIDSLRNFVNRYIRNSAVESFTNLRLNTAMNGLIRFVDSARSEAAGIVSATALNDSTIRIITTVDTFDVTLATGGGTGTNNSNLGSGFRVLISSSQGLRTLTNGYAIGIDSTSNSNALTFKADTGLLTTRGWHKKGIDSLANLIGVGTVTGSGTTNLFTAWNTSSALRSISLAADSSNRYGFGKTTKLNMGRMNIYADSSMSTGISVAGNANYILTHNLSDFYGTNNAMDFGWVAGRNHTVNAGGSSNWTAGWGSNSLNTYLPKNTKWGAGQYVVEGNYDFNFTPGQGVVEMHWRHWDTLNREYRFITTAARHNGEWGDMGMRFRKNTFYDWANTEKMLIDYDVNQFQFKSGMYLNINTNNIDAIIQRNAANSANISVIGVDASDYVGIGGNAVRVSSNNIIGEAADDPFNVGLTGRKVGQVILNTSGTDAFVINTAASAAQWKWSVANYNLKQISGNVELKTTYGYANGTIPYQALISTTSGHGATGMFVGDGYSGSFHQSDKDYYILGETRSDITGDNVGVNGVVRGFISATTANWGIGTNTLVSGAKLTVNGKTAIQTDSIAIASADNMLTIAADGTIKRTSKPTGGGGGSTALNGITDATGTGSISNANYGQEWRWDALSGSAMSFTSTSTAAASNAQKLVYIETEGANATSTQTTYGLDVINLHTGTASTNVGLRARAQDGTNNYAAIFPSGFVGIGTSTPTTLFEAVSSANTWRFNNGAGSATPGISLLNGTDNGFTMATGSTASILAFDKTKDFYFAGESFASISGNNAGGSGSFAPYMLITGSTGAADFYGIAGYTATRTLTGTNFVYKSHLDSLLAFKAPLASPTFTGTPAAPTATAGTNTTQIATTAFVQAALSTFESTLDGNFIRELTTTGTTTTTIDTLSVSADSSFVYSVVLMAKKDDNTIYKSERKVTVKNIAGAITAPFVETVGTDQGEGTWTVTISVDDTVDAAGGPLLRVAGMAATNIYWTITVSIIGRQSLIGS